MPCLDTAIKWCRKINKGFKLIEKSTGDSVKEILQMGELLQKGGSHNIVNFLKSIEVQYSILVWFDLATTKRLFSGIL